MCVQRFDDSRRYAIRITYRISLRSSSLWEPRHPLLKVVWHLRHMRGGRKQTRKTAPPAPSFRKVNVYYCFFLGYCGKIWRTHMKIYTLTYIILHTFLQKCLIHNMYKFAVIDLGDLGSLDTREVDPSQRRRCHKLNLQSFHVVMILPQVHLRKPCYDFTFL